MAYLTKADILNRRNLRTEEVEVPEWGGSIRIRELTAKEMDEFESSNAVRDSNGKFTVNFDNIRAKFLVRCICDEKGEPIFTEDDVAQLGDLSSVALQRVFAAAQKLNGRSEDSFEEAKKNF